MDPDTPAASAATDVWMHVGDLVCQWVIGGPFSLGLHGAWITDQLTASAHLRLHHGSLDTPGSSSFQFGPEAKSRDLHSPELWLRK